MCNEKKAALRKAMQRIRDNLVESDRACKSLEIAQRAMQLPEHVASKKVLYYSAFRSEVDVNPLIIDAIVTGKEVYMPRCVQNFVLEAVKITSINDLKIGKYGILEPIGDRLIDIEMIDMVILPLLAFDTKLFRLGYGAGYYDRLLTNRNVLKVGVAFDVQLVEDTYRESHDVALDMIITENKIYKNIQI